MEDELHAFFEKLMQSK